MKIKYAPLIALLASFPALISAIVPPGASTPLFYLVSTTSTSPTLNLLVSPPIPPYMYFFFPLTNDLIISPSS
jgi:hypothetical protein